MKCRLPALRVACLDARVRRRASLTVLSTEPHRRNRATRLESSKSILDDAGIFAIPRLGNKSCRRPGFAW